MEVQDNIISLESELLSFDRYFEANSRCVLSAPFGEGKSFFLNEFIKKKSNDYDFITLYPTGYQICDNKDVFEYIKRDILLALLALDPSFLNALDKTNAAIIWESISECRLILALERACKETNKEISKELSIVADFIPTSLSAIIN